MIRKPGNWENVQAFSERKALPLGAYVCKVLKAAVTHSDYGDMLQIGFDIAEGDHIGFFKRNFDATPSTEKKWPGILRVFLPRDDGSEKDEMTKRSLKGVVTAFEKSNPGFKWVWGENGESALVGKQIGILFRNEEWEWQGRTGWKVRPFRALSVDTVRNNSYTLPEDKPLHSNAASAAPAGTTSGYTAVEPDELPF